MKYAAILLALAAGAIADQAAPSDIAAISAAPTGDTVTDPFFNRPGPIGNGTTDDHKHYTTITTTAFTTYCPEPTHFTHGDKTYTVTAATTLTITDCPCTITRPIIPTATARTRTVTVCTTSGGPQTETQGPVNPTNPPINPTQPIIPTQTGKPGPVPNISTKTNGGVTTGTGSPVQPTTPVFTGAAVKMAHEIAGMVMGAMAGVAILAL